MQLGYWDIRGLAQPIRYVLQYGKFTYQERRYKCGPAPTFDRSDWTNEKFTLGLDFPNLPYLIDGDVKIVQNLAILRYLAPKCDLVGKTEEEKVRCDIVEQQLVDFRTNFVRLCYSPKFADEKGAYLASLPGVLKSFSDYLGNRKFFAGDHLTYVDFLVYEMLFQNMTFSKDSFKDVSNLVDFVARIEALPSMQDYMKSDQFVKWPFNGDMAGFGSKLQPSPF